MNPSTLRQAAVSLAVGAAFLLGITTNRSGFFPPPRRLPPRQVQETFTSFWDAWDLVEEQDVRATSIGPEGMAHGAIRGLLESLGDSGHTTYLSVQQLRQLRDRLDGMENGIGAAVQRKGDHATVVGVAARSPAVAAGLCAGDVILAVDGEDVRDLTPRDLEHRLEGPAGSVVRVRVARGRSGDNAELAIVRQRYELPVVTWQMVPGQTMAHVAIRSFARHTGAQLQEALREAKKQGAEAVILDLRDNPGGFRDQAVATTSAFLGAGAVLLEIDGDGRRRAIPVTGDGMATDLPLVVLVDGNTASAAEIVAAALQDHARAPIVGTRTFGTGTVLQSFSLSDGSAVLLAVAKWLPPRGQPVWHHGIVPDIEVSPTPHSRAHKGAVDADPALAKAVQVLREKLPPRSK